MIDINDEDVFFYYISAEGVITLVSFSWADAENDNLNIEDVSFQDVRG